MTFIDNSERINCYERIKSKKKCIILGVCDFDYLKMKKIYEDYLENWYYIFEYYDHVEISNACAFFRSLDKKN